MRPADSTGRRQRQKHATRRGPPSWFAVPALLLFFLFYAIPNLANIALALTNWSTFMDELSFVGLQNFRDLHDEGIFLPALWTTLKFALIVVVVENLVTLTIAVALEHGSRLTALFRALFFLPVLISPLAAGYVFRAMLDPTGTYNRLVSLVTSTSFDKAWLGSGSTALIAVALVHAWKFGGIHMMVYIAGLNSIPDELIEASRIDGASAWQIFWKIKLPLLGPAITFNVTLTLIGALSAFEMILAMTRGGPGRATEVLNIYVLQQFSTGAFGYATSTSLVLFLIICLAAFPTIAFLRRRETQL